MTKRQKRQKYWHVTDYQGEVLSYHTSEQRAERAIVGHVADNDGQNDEFRVHAPLGGVK